MKNPILGGIVASLLFAVSAFASEPSTESTSLTQEGVAFLNPQPSAEAAELVQRLRDRSDVKDRKSVV